LIFRLRCKVIPGLASECRGARTGRDPHLHPSAYQLCAAAQHALGLAALGSWIDVAHIAVRVRAAGRLLLAFVGEAALWWLANMPSRGLRTAIDHLLGEIRERSAAP
jgi:hypothetical protein